MAAMVSSQSSLMAEVRRGTLLQIQELLKKDPSQVNAVSERGYSPLLEACASGKFYLVGMLIKKNANVLALTPGKRNLLHFCIQAGNPTDNNFKEVIAKVIRDNPSLVNGADGNGETPFHRACRKRNTFFFPLCLNAGADRNLCNGQGKLPLQIAIDVAFKRGVEALLRKDFLQVDDALMHQPDIAPEILKILQKHNCRGDFSGALWNNTVKANRELQRRFPSPANIALDCLHLEEKVSPVWLKYTVCATQGERETQEDTSFYYEKEDFVLAGVFDGHGAKGDSNETSALCAQNFGQLFFKHLERLNSSVRHAFEATVYELHEKAIELSYDGSTAVVCYFNCRTGEVYTMTLGDSLAFVYRGQKAIALSPFTDWSSPKEVERVIARTGNAKIRSAWVNAECPKLLRFPIGWGINISRTIGDRDCSPASFEKPVLIQKPKVGIFRVQPGDCIVIGSDGIWDEVQDQQEVVDQISSRKEEVPLADHLIGFTLGKNSSDLDNVTIIAIECLPFANDDGVVVEQGQDVDHRRGPVEAAVVDKA